MKSTALLTGPYDWDPALLPRAEFESRVAMVRSAMAARGMTGLLVHGDSAEHGTLAYLTGFTPKLGPAFAFVPGIGPLRLLVSGGASMLGASRRLTWVEDLRPLSDPQKSLEAWLRSLMGNEPGSGPAPVELCGSRAMTRQMRLLLTNAAGSLARSLGMEDSLDAVRRSKSPVEREMSVQACRILTVANRVFAGAAARGAGARSAAIEAERAAFRAGAQDVRMLASASDGGPPLPFHGVADVVVHPMLVCMAVRFAGYWAEGLTTIAPAGGAVVHAEAALAAMLDNARAGVKFRDLAQVACAHAHPYRPHPLIEAAPCSSIGLSLDEPSDSLEDGGIYTLRAGAASPSGAHADNAVISAMIAVTESGIEILWRGAGQ